MSNHIAVAVGQTSKFVFYCIGGKFVKIFRNTLPYVLYIVKNIIMNIVKTLL